MPDGQGSLGSSWPDLRQAGARFIGAQRIVPTPKRPTRPGETTRNLILAYRPGWQSLADLNAMARHVRDLDQTIGVFILASTLRNSIARKAAARLPSLIVSPGRMLIFQPKRGKVYQGSPKRVVMRYERSFSPVSMYCWMNIGPRRPGWSAG